MLATEGNGDFCFPQSQYLEVVMVVLHSTNITGFAIMVARLNLMPYVKQDSLWHRFNLRSDILLPCLQQVNVKLSFHVYMYILETCNVTIFSGFLIIVFLDVTTLSD